MGIRSYFFDAEYIDDIKIWGIGKEVNEGWISAVKVKGPSPNFIKIPAYDNQITEEMIFRSD